jgi:hypothetical protein
MRTDYSKNTPTARMEMLKVFFSYVVVGPDWDSCWSWRGYKVNGYGVHTSPFYMAKKEYAHRISWQIAHSRQIPKGKMVLHHCDNPECTRPDHLFLGTCKDNMQDAISKGRMAWQKNKLKKGLTNPSA